MPLVANVLFHKTPCCGAEFFTEYPRDMKSDEEWVSEVVCKSCQVKYELVLSEFTKGTAKRGDWYARQEEQ